MRQVARYGFNAHEDDVDAAENERIELNTVVTGWLDDKAAEPRDWSEEVENVHLDYEDGRTAFLTVERIHCSRGTSRSWMLQEETLDGLFRTSLQVGRMDDELAVSCELAAGDPRDVVAPVRFDPHCPRVIRTILDRPPVWSLGSSRLATKHAVETGSRGGESVGNFLHSRERRVPLVIVSELDGEPLHDDLAAGLAWDLAGLAIVVQIDDDASWHLTRRFGPEWSCYNGAVRIYWPFRANERDPFRHTLWTASKLRRHVDDDLQAANRIRRWLRHRVLGTSTYSVKEPDMFVVLEDLQVNENLSRARENVLASLDTDELREFADERLTEIVDLELAEVRQKLRRERQQRERLETDLANTQALLNHERQSQAGAETTATEPEAATEAEPLTLAEAVQRAGDRYPHSLVFGKDVDKGIDLLDETGIDPGKIYEQLAALGELGRELDSSGLGTSPELWLRQKGVRCTGETETVRNNTEEQARRTWDDGTGRTVFDLHLKPKEGTPRNRAVRIYFRLDQEAGLVRVGWIGPHL